MQRAASEGGMGGSPCDLQAELSEGFDRAHYEDEEDNNFSSDQARYDTMQFVNLEQAQADLQGVLK
eukprot:1268751-Pyramimonas_sp.AAC.1